MEAGPPPERPAAAVRGFAHVGVLVPELDAAATLFRDRLGVEVRGPEEEPELGLRILWVQAGDVLLEFVAPAREDSRAAAAIDRGEAGVHHIALEVDGLDTLLGEIAATLRSAPAPGIGEFLQVLPFQCSASGRSALPSL